MAKVKSRKISYRKVGDYRIPNVRLSDDADIKIGMWGQLHKDYLMEHKKEVFAILFADGTLNAYLAGVNERARDMCFEVYYNLVKSNSEITEELKESDQMKWVGETTNAWARAREIVLNEPIYK